MLEQNRNREYSVPEPVIVQLLARTEEPSQDEGFGAVVIM